MADAKYGRLFTDADVLAIIDEAVVAAQEDDSNSVLEGFAGGSMRRHLDELIARAEADKAPMTFPPDEPLFLLRGQDRLAAEAVGRYVQGCLFYLEQVVPPVGAEHVGAVSAAYQEFYRWQLANPDRVKVPE